MKLRYKHAEVLMIIGMIISVVVSYYAASVIDKAWEIKRIDKPYRASYLYELIHTDMEIVSSEERRWTGDLKTIEMDDIAAVAQIADADMTVTFNMSIGHATAGNGVTVFFRKPKDMVCELNYEATDKTAPIVYLGKTMEQFVTERSGRRFIWLNEIEAQVGGVLQSMNIADYDERVMVDYSTCGEEHKKLLTAVLNRNLVWGAAPGIEIKHTAPLSMEEREEMGKSLETINIRLIDKETYNLDEDINATQAVLEVIFIILLYVFVIVNQFSICRLWFTEREGEFVVRKRCGTRSWEMMKLLLADFFRLFTWAVILGLPVMFFLGWFMKDGALSASRVLFSLVTVLVTAIMMFILLLERFFRWFRRINLGKT